jgi:actin-related protein
VTHTVPIYEGFALSHAIMKIPQAGRDLTDYLIKLVDEANKSFLNLAENRRIMPVRSKKSSVLLHRINQ